MERKGIMSRDFFCERCSLQFDKAYVFDLHLSLIHGEKKIEVKVDSPICEENLKETQISETEFYFQTVKNFEVKVESPICEENLQETQISETEFSYQTVKNIEVKVQLPLCKENLQESQISETEFSYQTVKKPRSLSNAMCVMPALHKIEA